ncbi:MAG: response regulator transcription factor, partial [Bdellovibrionales bacterium]|nr:response regulator transcription factor [Bdellovibrionales bacterium]
ELEKYHVFLASGLSQAFQIESTEKLNLVILDLGLSDGSGFEFLANVRSKGSRLPIIILSAQTDEDSVVKGLQLGANDYMRKPFSNREFIARVKTVLKEPQHHEEQIRIGDLLILLNQRSITYQETPIGVNRREFDILLHFSQRLGTIVSRENLIQAIDKELEIFDRTIDSHVSHLRTKLKKAGVKNIKISSVYGMGYRMEKL